MGAWAIINSKLVIPGDVNGACEFWSSAQGCRPILDHSCIAAGASFEWVVFTDTAHLALLSQPGLLVCGLKSLCLALVRVTFLLPLEVQTFTECTMCAVVDLTSPMKAWYQLFKFLTWAFKDYGLLRTETLSTLI